VFWSPEVKVGEQAAFQITLTAPSSITISSIPFSHATIHFSDDVSPIVVEHENLEVEDEVGIVKLGNIDPSVSDREAVRGNLRWQPGGSIVFTGTMSSEVPTVLKVIMFLQHSANCSCIDSMIGHISCPDNPRKWLESRCPRWSTEKPIAVTFGTKMVKFSVTFAVRSRS